MAKIVIIFGLISGAIIALLMTALTLFVSDGTLNFDNGTIVGYTTMLIALSMIFFGIKSYRDNHGGRITFLKGLQVGILITLISALCYGVTWEVYQSGGRGEDFMQKYTTYYLDKMKKEGASEAEVEKARTDGEEFMKLYQNFFIRFAMVLMEILPVGIIVTLISAALLRKREVLPAQPA